VVISLVNSVAWPHNVEKEYASQGVVVMVRYADFTHLERAPVCHVTDETELSEGGHFATGFRQAAVYFGPQASTIQRLGQVT
jgi:hypothetical protein